MMRAQAGQRFAQDTTIDLLTLQNNITTVIAKDTVPSGKVKEVRIILGDGNYIVSGGTRYDLATPSAEESGLKIKIGKDLGLSMNTFVLDFDAALSIKEENNNFKLMPVIRLK